MLVDGFEIKVIWDEVCVFGIVVLIGISEKFLVSVGVIWNFNLLIGEDGEIFNYYCKLVLIFYEKLIWVSGDGVGLCVVDIGIGKIG